MKKADPSQKQISPTRLQITAKHYAAAIFSVLDLVVYGLLILALIGCAIGVLS